MTGLSAWASTLIGVVVGAACGFTVRRARLCSFGAIEDAWMGGDTRRLRLFGLALAIALTGTQSLVGLGWLDPSNSTYVQPVSYTHLYAIITSVLTVIQSEMERRLNRSAKNAKGVR